MKVCLILQVVLLVLAIRYFHGHERYVPSPSMIQTMVVLTMVMGILVVGNLMQIAVWALIFQAMGEFPNFADAYYHSAVNFATLGYGDVVMS